MPRLTVDLLCRCTGHATKRRRDEKQERFLAKLTHLYCSEKGIESIVIISCLKCTCVFFLGKSPSMS